MQHLEEGTIHAWLDEALSTEESARVEAHVQECGECAAMVADARGLIAGASRIVSALDIVPGGVLPKTASVAAASEKSLWRSLHLTPFRAALAASLMIAAASVFVVRGSADFAERPEYKVEAPTAAPTPPPAASPATTANSAMVAVAADSVVSLKREQRGSIPATQRANEAIAEKALAAPRVSQPLKTVAAADSTVRIVDSVARGVADARAIAPMPVAPPVVVSRADSGRRLADTARRLMEVVTTGTGGAAGRGGQPAQGRLSTDAAAAAQRAPQRAPLPAKSFASGYDFVGCYQVSDSTGWPRTLPTQFSLTRDSTTAGTGYVRLVRDARANTSVVGNWQATGPGMALVSFNGTTPASRFLFTQGAAGALLTQVAQEAARQESAARARAALVRMSCR